MHSTSYQITALSDGLEGVFIQTFIRLLRDPSTTLSSTTRAAINHFVVPDPALTPDN